MKEEDEDELAEDFNQSMMEFRNSQPHELERCRAVSKIGLKVQGLILDHPLKKVLSYVDDVQGHEVEYSLFQKIELYKQNSVMEISH